MYREPYNLFDLRLKALGLSKAAFARLLRIEPHIVSRWRKQGVPGYALAVVELLERDKQQKIELRKMLEVE